MADWRSLAHKLALVEGRLESKEARIINEELWSDGKVTKDEFEFLIALRRAAQSVAPEFDDMIFGFIKVNLLEDGCISAKETQWLEGFLISNGHIGPREKEFLADLKKSSRKHAPEFLNWCDRLGI